MFPKFKKLAFTLIVYNYKLQGTDITISWRFQNHWLIDWLIDFNFIYRRYPAKLLILVVDVPTSPERKCNIHVYDTARQPINPRDIILTGLVLVHAGYLFCNWLPLNTNHYGTTFGGMLGSFNSSQINACFVGIGELGPQFIVSLEGLGMHKMLPPRGFEPSTSRMSDKHHTPRPWWLNIRGCKSIQDSILVFKVHQNTWRVDLCIFPTDVKTSSWAGHQNSGVRPPSWHWFWRACRKDRCCQKERGEAW